MVRTDGWAGYGHVITKFSGVGRFTYPWCSAGALRAPDLRYNFYSYVHKHRECRLKQQYNGCKSPKGQEKTGPSWTYASYSKNGEKAIQCRFRLAKQQVYKCISLFHCHHCMTTMWNYFMFYELHKASIFFFYLSGAPNGNFRENICSEDDLRSRIFGAFVVKFLACLLLLGFSNTYKMV